MSFSSNRNFFLVFFIIFFVLSSCKTRRKKIRKEESFIPQNISLNLNEDHLLPRLSLQAKAPEGAKWLEVAVCKEESETECMPSLIEPLKYSGVGPLEISPPN